jgi:hypothetical protein
MAKDGQDSTIAECLNNVEKDTDTDNVSTEPPVDVTRQSFHFSVSKFQN